MILLVINLILIIVGPILFGYFLCELKWIRKIRKSIDNIKNYDSESMGRINAISELLD